MERLKSNDMSCKVEIFEDSDDLVSEENFENDDHNLLVKVNVNNGDVYFEFSSRLAMYDFAKSMIHDAIFNDGGMTELYPLGYDNKLHIVNGVRLKLNSSRVFVNYPCK
ncbi:hypothetical protein [Candidatus Sororendozoicomonas aggregata]|uniref:hypothetical protein n=1 Tax=Candidatus Sororendozoicomonas aggregata TaxID=3073239 RepID=UPI002ED1394D